MPGGVFSAKGTAVAPTNVFFGGVADRYTMLNQIYMGSAVAGVYNSPAAARLVSTWQPYNTNFNGGSNAVTASFGSSQSAPDGTNNGIKVIEGSNTGVHAVISATVTDQGQIGWTLRVSVFAKAAERTRFAIYVSDAKFDPNVPGGVGNGSKCVFDLAGVQIGVAPTNFGSTTPQLGYFGSNAEIVSFGSGPNPWCRCSFDVSVGSLGPAIGAQDGIAVSLLTDSGAGTAAESTSYAGNGTSGVLFWQATALPPAAWGLNTLMFNDDFTTLNTFDFNGGTNWATVNSWPEGSFNYHADSTKFSIVSGTILKILPNNIVAPAFGADPMTAQYNGAGGIVPNFGFQFRPSALIEYSYAYDMTGNSGIADGLAFWTINIEHLLDTPASTNATDIEHDFMENLPGGGIPYQSAATMLFGSSGTIARIGSMEGWIAWNAGVDFGIFTSGLQYCATDSTHIWHSINNGPNLNNPPASSPGSWTAYTPQHVFTNGDRVVDFVNTQQLFATLWLAHTQAEPGHVMTFFNGVFNIKVDSHMLNNYAHMTYHPTIKNVTSNEWFICDSLTFPLIMGPCNQVNTFIDYYRVTQ